MLVVGHVCVHQLPDRSPTSSPDRGDSDLEAAICAFSAVLGKTQGFLKKRLQTTTQKRIRELHTVVFVERSCSAFSLAPLPPHTHLGQTCFKSRFFRHPTSCVGRKVRFFSLLRVRNYESFLHPSVYVKMYRKQKVLCSCKLFALSLCGDLGSLPGQPEGCRLED